MGTEWEEWKVREVDSGECCTTLLVYLQPLCCVLKNGQNGQFNVMHILPQFFFFFLNTKSSAGREKAAGDKDTARKPSLIIDDTHP